MLLPDVIYIYIYIYVCIYGKGGRGWLALGCDAVTRCARRLDVKIRRPVESRPVEPFEGRPARPIYLALLSDRRM
jgi:hypothetical protein